MTKDDLIDMLLDVHIPDSVIADEADEASMPYFAQCIRMLDNGERKYLYNKTHWVRILRSRDNIVIVTKREDEEAIEALPTSEYKDIQKRNWLLDRASEEICDAFDMEVSLDYSTRPRRFHPPNPQRFG